MELCNILLSSVPGTRIVQGKLPIPSLIGMFFYIFNENFNVSLTIIEKDGELADFLQKYTFALNHEKV